MTASHRIRERFGSLSPGLQRAGKYALDHPNEIVTVSMRSIAQRADVPPATLVRFAQTLGFAGWPQLKEAFAQELGLAPEQYGQRTVQPVGGEGETQDVAVLSDLYDAQAHNMAYTKTHSGLPLGRAAALLVASAQVHVAGFRASFPLAFAFAYGYRMLRSTVQLLDAGGGGLEMQMRAMVEGDAVVVIGFSPYSRETEWVARTARGTGCKIVALTDSPASPLSLLADETLLFSALSPSGLPSTAAGMALAEALLALVIHETGSAAAERIKVSEEALFAANAYLPRPSR
jgi:DNA-binding MurR/RpiR family transcriptional regulator